MADGEATTELDVAALLHEYRSQGDLYFDESFGTIAGYADHGAIVHYEADAASNAQLQPRGLLLVDSGAQYLDGTTDITRTIALGEPTAEEKRDFTLVMKGHIALANTVFPAGTRGAQLDAIARQFLWKNGLSYLHGTGHGVGHFLSVHEGPTAYASTMWKHHCFRAASRRTSRVFTARECTAYAAKTLCYAASLWKQSSAHSLALKHLRSSPSTARSSIRRL